MIRQLVSGRSTDGIRPLRPGRDLGQLADLIAQAFGRELSEGGEHVLRELRLLSALGPLSILFTEMGSEVDGLFTGLVWEQENPNYLYLLHDNAPRQVFSRARPFNSQSSLDCSRVLPGLTEGFFEAFANLYRGVARAIRNKQMENGEFPTIYDGVRGMKFIEASVESNRKGNVWVDM